MSQEVEDGIRKRRARECGERTSGNLKDRKEAIRSLGTLAIIRGSPV